MEVKLIFPTKCRVAISDGLRSYGIVSTNAKGELTWDAPASGKYNFVNLGNAVNSKMNISVTVAPDIEFIETAYAGAWLPGWLIASGVIATPIGFGMILGGIYLAETGTPIKQENGNLIYLG